MKKIILFIVEGRNDEREIKAALHRSKHFEQYKTSYEICFAVQGTDITQIGLFSKGKKKVENIRSKIDGIVLKFRRGEFGAPYNNIADSEIQEVVQIVDLDGVFIDRHDRIIEGTNSHIKYEDDCIITNDVDWIRRRNRIKGENLQKLIQAKNAGGIPYSIYYVSCNMDHVLFNNRNAVQFEKDAAAERVVTLGDAIDAFLEENLFSEGIMTDSNYQQSWEEIQLDTNSLNRHTNFNLFFDERAKNPK